MRALPDRIHFGSSKFLITCGLGCCLALLMSACAHDPGVAKKKYFDSGTAYFQKGKYREAAIQFANATKVDKEFVDAHYMLAQCLLNVQDWNGAYTELMKTVELQPTNIKAQTDLAKLLVAGREYPLALAAATAVLKLDANNLDGHMLLANAAAGSGDSVTAMAEADIAVRLAPDNASAYLTRGGLDIQYHDLAKAEQDYRKAASLDSKSVTSLTALADFYRSQSRWSDAEQAYGRILHMDPKNRNALIGLATTYGGEGFPDKAEQQVIKAKQELASEPDGYRVLGDYYFDVGREDKALAEYESLYREHPKDLRVKKNYVQLLILNNRLDEAGKLDAEILKSDSKDIDGLNYKGQILGRQGHPADALPVLDSAIKAAPDNAEAHYFRGVAYSEIGKADLAEADWREAIRLRPNMTLAQKAIAQVATRKGDYGQMISSGDQIVSAQPQSPDGYLLRGSGKLGRNDVNGAEADFQKAISLAPGSPAGYSRLGFLRLSQKSYPDAEKLFNQALDRDPNSSEALQGLVGMYLQQKNTDKAITRISEQLAKAPQNAGYYFLQGALYFSEKKMDESRVALEKSLSLDKNNESAMLLLGQVQIAQGGAASAIAGYEKAIQQNPSDPRAYVLLAALYTSQNQWPKAEDLYRRALQVEPGYSLAATKLAAGMLEHGENVDVAVSYAQLGRQGMPDSADAADTLGWAYYNKGTYGLAADLLQEAIKKSPNDANYRFHLGMTLLKSGNKTQAKANLEAVLRLDPNFPRSNEVRSALAQTSLN